MDVQGVVRDTIRRIGYTKPEYGFEANSCGVLSAIHEQSPDIACGVNRADCESQGAGDQGIMFGYACDETKVFMPATLYLANLLVKTLSDIRREGEVLTYLRPDAKSQVTLEYDEQGKPCAIDTLLVSTQHDEFASDSTMHEIISENIRNYVIPVVKKHLRDQRENGLLEMFEKDFRLLVNPTGKFVIGGPAADTGLTGRKIICDTYGGYAPHGGGAFSGKDPSKVDRSAAYMARYVAKNLVANGICSECLIQLSYAIGIAEPVSITVKTKNLNPEYFKANEELAAFVSRRFDLTPYGIDNRLNLCQPIYRPTAFFGHFGREPYGKYFPWEQVMTLDELMTV